MVITIKTLIDIIWIFVTIIIIFSSIYFSFKLKFTQFNLKSIIKTLIDKEKTNGISSLDTLFMSLASKIGIGSLAGIAFSIYYGGIGTLFWIWISSFFISINSYVENYLSIIYKKKDNSFYKGGPAYYIKYGLNKKKLACFYAVLLIITYLFGFITIQNNTITRLTNIIYNISPIYISLIVSLLCIYFIFKGLKSISNICNKIVPFMSIIYLIIGFVIFILNIDRIPSFFTTVIISAFEFKSFIGGFIACFIIGIQKSIFASEAGLGTGSIASGSTSSNDPKKQGMIGIISTYFINLIVSTITGFIIYFSNYNNVSFSNINGIELTKYAFSYHLGYFGDVMLLILIVLFAFSTIVTGYYYSESNLKFFTSNKNVIIALKIITVITLFLGGICNSFVIWSIIDLLLAILSLINLYALIKLKDKVI